MKLIARLAPVLGLLAAAGLLTGCRGSEDSDAKRRQTVTEVRKFWREQSEILRKYYQTKPGTPPKAYTP